MKFSYGADEFQIRPKYSSRKLAQMRGDLPSMMEVHKSMFTATESGTRVATIQSDLMAALLGGVGPDELSVVLSFLADCLVALTVDGEPVDWLKMELKERVDMLDMELSTMHQLLLFTLAFSHYESGGSRVKEVKDVPDTPKKRRRKA